MTDDVKDDGEVVGGPDLPDSILLRRSNDPGVRWDSSESSVPPLFVGRWDDGLGDEGGGRDSSELSDGEAVDPPLRDLVSLSVDQFVLDDIDLWRNDPNSRGRLASHHPSLKRRKRTELTLGAPSASNFTCSFCSFENRLMS